ncbi:hypothetical protein [Streptomyces daliensis]|uniref:Uncharacterized protein n=1 Tax=Streptomyces daliensis TaxID=299421 RepID=A0A8T4IUP1_9ACTN|nr:hypothetical protein [Streptomyces daliensis]
MRWLALYARSRQVPASAAAIVLVALGVWAFGGHGADGGDGGGPTGPADPRLVALVLTTGVTIASVGFGGQDVALDRTAAIRWVPRRAAHVLLAGAVVGALLLALRAVGPALAPVAFVVRDSAGLAGLAALGATVCGAPYAWTLPAGWLAFTLFAPQQTGVPGPGQVAGWLLLPPGTAVATWTALTLLVGGTALYAVAGPARGGVARR